MKTKDVVSIKLTKKQLETLEPLFEQAETDRDTNSNELGLVFGQARKEYKDGQFIYFPYAYAVRIRDIVIEYCYHEKD